MNHDSGYIKAHLKLHTQDISGKHAQSHWIQGLLDLLSVRGTEILIKALCNQEEPGSSLRKVFTDSVEFPRAESCVRCRQAHDHSYGNEKLQFASRLSEQVSTKMYIICFFLGRGKPRAEPDAKGTVESYTCYRRITATIAWEDFGKLLKQRTNEALRLAVR